MLTLFVCNGTSCGDKAELSVGSIDPILNVDKAFIGSFSANAEKGVIGGGGGSSPIDPNAGYKVIVSQFDLESGSVASHLGVAALAATAPFVVAYILLALHQVWLRNRVTRRPNPTAKDAGEDTAEGAKPWPNRRGGGCIGHHAGTILLLAGVVIAAFVVMLPIVVFGESEPEILPKFEEEVALPCPGCINGVPVAEYLEATPVTTNSRQVRATLMSQAVRVRQERVGAGAAIYGWCDGNALDRPRARCIESYGRLISYPNPVWTNGVAVLKSTVFVWTASSRVRYRRITRLGAVGGSSRLPLWCVSSVDMLHIYQKYNLGSNPAGDHLDAFFQEKEECLGYKIWKSWYTSPVVKDEDTYPRL